MLTGRKIGGLFFAKMFDKAFNQCYDLSITANWHKGAFEMIDNILLIHVAFYRLAIYLSIIAGALWFVGIALIAATDKPKNRRFRSSFGWL